MRPATYTVGAGGMPATYSGTPTTYTVGAGGVTSGATRIAGGYSSAAVAQPQRVITSVGGQTTMPTMTTMPASSSISYGARPAAVSSWSPSNSWAVQGAATSPTAVRTVPAGSFGLPTSTVTGQTYSTGGLPYSTVTSQPRVISSSGLAQSPTLISSPTIISSSGYAPASQVTYVTQAAGPANMSMGFAAASQNAYEAKHKDDDQLNNLKALKKACGLKKVRVRTAADAFKAAAIDGQLTRDQFFECHSKLLDSCEVEHPPPEVKNAVFDLFDRDDNGSVDMMEIICGISLLCKGSEDEKVEAVFMMFDENGDGFVTTDEMYKFLNAVFKVVCTPSVMAAVNSVGVNVESCDEMASATTLECFQCADLNHDGKLSLDEFKKWFYAPRNDPELLFQPVKQMLN